MWFRLRYTERRGRSSEPSTLLRMCALRRCRSSCFFMLVEALITQLPSCGWCWRYPNAVPLRSSRLALLAADGFLGVLHALPLVGFGRAQLADLGSHQADLVLVGALHREAVRLGVVLRRDAFGERIDDRVREAQGHVDLLAL